MTFRSIVGRSSPELNEVIKQDIQELSLNEYMDEFRTLVSRAENMISVK